MMTLKETMNLWKAGCKGRAFDSYLKDEGSIKNIDFDTFCLGFSKIEKTHDQNEEATKAHSSIRCD